MSKHLEIKRAQTKDEPAVRQCAEEAYEQYAAAIGKKPAPMVADFASLIDSEHVYVAVDLDDDILGFIAFFQRGDHMFLENVAVRRNATGRGVGKRLIEFCEEVAKDANLGSVKLYTNEKMTENLSLYPHLGYQETERRREDGFNRIFFEKTI
ncbi:GNAT family N-acetyltransferase [Ruegeria sp.]|uniref:GNAT family N-acetyltransferase n=1 Tax=Ruegeria sp. TaxID=1879320 RepID=UPI003C7A37FD